jgi:hypothetical protein
MTLPRTLFALTALAGLSACVSSDGPAEDYAFVGTWDCQVETFTFTNTTYSYGDKTLPIKAVRQDNRNFTLYFADGYVIGLGAVTATGLTWVSGASGDQFNCKRV